ncbi:hypothetical protein U9M48_029425 [Paspalum notatum var. saurae]|uniref:Retrotransposon protein, putative, unclassified n=1 Tax=Paspalum notatum var. saurae TaxID=547442 RepID=A0AAQ3TXU6_PASNO
MARTVQQFFSQIFGVAASRERTVDLAALGFVPSDLSALDEPFSEEEVLEAIRAMLADRAPGPDGFTGAFYKAAWSIIKKDVLAALNVFHTGRGRGF